MGAYRSRQRHRLTRRNNAHKALEVFFLCGLFFILQLIGPQESPVPIFHSSFSQSGISFEAKAATIDFIDVGQGSASLLCFSDGRTMLVDTGPASGRSELLELLRERNITKLDSLVVTHQHGDHAGNVSAVLDFCDVYEIVMPIVPESLLIDPPRYEKIYHDIKDRGLTVQSPRQGEVLLSGEDYSVTVLSDDTGPYAALNDYSIILRVVVGDVSVLMMADAEKTTETQLMREGVGLDSDILLVGHHGNRNGATTPFLEAVTPDTAVVSVGQNNFGQPATSVIMRLLNAGCEIFRTDREGTVTVETDGQDYAVFTASDF